MHWSMNPAQATNPNMQAKLSRLKMVEAAQRALEDMEAEDDGYGMSLAQGSDQYYSPEEFEYGANQPYPQEMGNEAVGGGRLAYMGEEDMEEEDESGFPEEWRDPRFAAALARFGIPMPRGM